MVKVNSTMPMCLQDGEWLFLSKLVFSIWRCNKSSLRLCLLCQNSRCDVALTQRGVVEAVEAGQVFASHGLTFRKCYTSLLTRSIVTAQRALEAAGVAYTPIEYDWRINERHYG
jgi:broad specificity phosphatase PhoE